MDNPSQVLSILVVVYLACSIASRIYVCSARAQFTFSTLSNYHPLTGGHSITPGLSDLKNVTTTWSIDKSNNLRKSDYFTKLQYHTRSKLFSGGLRKGGLGMHCRAALRRRRAAHYLLQAVGLAVRVHACLPGFCYLLCNMDLMQSSSHYCFWRGRYWIASARCGVSIFSQSAKSAIVRASFRMR